MIKIAIVGTGGIAEWHANEFKKNHNSEVVAACDVSETSAACIWSGIYEQNETTVKYLVPLMPTMGIVIIVIKVLMTAAARGRD